MKRRSDSEVLAVVCGLMQMVLLDDALCGLDVATRKSVQSLLNDLKSDRDTAGRLRRVILSTGSNMQEAEYHADRVALLGAGKVLLHDTLPALKFAFCSGYELALEIPLPKDDETHNELLGLLCSAFTSRESQNPRSRRNHSLFL